MILQLHPPKTGMGAMDNYYHFVVDLMLPLSVLGRQRPGNNAIILPDVGSFKSVVTQVYGSRFEFISSALESPDLVRVDLFGMNPKIIHCRKGEIKQLRADVLESTDSKAQRKPDKLVFIERTPPPPGALPGSGSLRRSLPNQAEIWEALKESCLEGLTPVHVQLEHLSFNQQVELFRSARIVIGQHGAGLTNCLWMQPGSAVIEVNPYGPARPHFKILAKLAGLEYLTVPQNGEHGVVAPDLLIFALRAIAD